MAVWRVNSYVVLIVHSDKEAPARQIRGCVFSKSFTLEISFDKLFVDIPMLYNSKLIYYCHTKFITQNIHQPTALGMAMVLLGEKTEVRCISPFCAQHLFGTLIVLKMVDIFCS